MGISVFLISAVSLLCAALAAGIYLLKSDIRKLSAKLAEIKKAGTNARLTTATFDKDISELCEQMNAYIDTSQDIVTACERSNAELKKAVTNISHDLRTPLTSAAGYAQMLRQSDPPKETRDRYLAAIENRLAALSGLINALFEYSRIIEGGKRYNIERVNIGNILRDTAAAFYDELVKRNFTVNINIPDEPVYANCDAQAYKRAAENLIQNALAHGRGFFELSLNKKNGAVFRSRLKEQDIDKLDTARMFDRFYTADLSRAGGSAGLGLAITKELAEGMGGTVTADLDGDVLCIGINLTAA